MFSTLEGKRLRPWRPLSSAHHWTTTTAADATVITFLLLVFTVCKSNVDGVFHENDKIHVVNIRVHKTEGTDFNCPNKCTGTLLTSTMVLTAASCTEYEYILNDTEIMESTTKSTPMPENTTTTTISSLMPSNATTIEMVYLSSPSTKLQRIVIRKYVSPEWEWKTKLGNLVLLKLNAHFPNYFRSAIESLLDNFTRSVPARLYLKGFGKIRLKLYPEQPIDDKEGRRTILTEYKNDCPILVNGTITEKDPNWWSFICARGEFIGANTSDTLCDEDIGGPLYDSRSPGMAVLFGMFSHAYHLKHPMCATRLCYVNEGAPFPCTMDRNMSFYKFTALLGRYANWVNQTVEDEHREKEPTLPQCPWDTTTTTHSDFRNATDVPTDKVYDADVYSDRRLMVANYKMCPKYRASSTTVAATASAVVVAAALTTRWHR